MKFLWKKKHLGTLTGFKKYDLTTVRSTLQTAGCSQGRLPGRSLAFVLAWASAQFLTLNPRLRLGSLLKGHFEVASGVRRGPHLPPHSPAVDCHAADEWQMRLDCAQLENDFLRKRLQQCEERLDSEMKARTELEQKVRKGGGPGPQTTGVFSPPL